MFDNIYQDSRVYSNALRFNHDLSVPLSFASLLSSYTFQI